MASCDLIMAELLEIKAEIQLLNDKFILKAEKPALINEISSAITSVVNQRIARLEAYKESLEKDVKLINSLVEKIIKMILNFFRGIDDKF